MREQCKICRRRDKTAGLYKFTAQPRCGSSPAYGLLAPQLLQKLPVFTAPQEQVQSAEGLFAPQPPQKLPVFFVPQEQVHSPAGAGFLEPQLLQKLPVFSAPQEHFQVFAAACCAAAC